MMIKPAFIKARDIPDAWFQCVNQVQEVGFRYEIQQGSYVGQTRLEFDWITIQIDHPYSEIYDTMLPEIPQHLGIPNPVANGYMDQYLPYLMSGHKEDTEYDTYGFINKGENKNPNIKLKHLRRRKNVNIQFRAGTICAF